MLKAEFFASTYLIVKWTVGRLLSSCVLFLISNSQIHCWVDVHPDKFLSFNHIYIHLREKKSEIKDLNVLDSQQTESAIRKTIMELLVFEISRPRLIVLPGKTSL